MPLPEGLKWDDRLAPYTHARKGPGYYFRCRRPGHRDGVKKHLTFIPGLKTDAKEFRSAHDVAHHNTLYRQAGLAPERNITVGALCTEYLAHVERLEVEGKQDPQTTRHYAYVIERFIRPGLGRKTVRELAPADVSEFVRWAKANTKSRGAAIIDALSGLKTMMRWRGFGSLADDLKIPTKEIAAEKQPKRDLDVETIRRLIAEMPDGSLEEAIAYLKARTGARDVEILSARKEEFDLKLGVFAPILHSKRKQKRHVYALTDAVVRKVRPFVLAAKPGGHVFTDDQGRPMTTERLRPRIRAASKRAGILAKKKNTRWIGRGGKGKKEYEVIIGAIDSIAPIRAEIVTLVADASSIADAAAHIGHESEETSARWYYKDRLTMEKLEQKRKVAEVIENALPLK